VSNPLRAPSGAWMTEVASLCVRVRLCVSSPLFQSLMGPCTLERRRSLTGNAHPVACRNDAATADGGLRRQQSCRTRLGGWNSKAGRYRSTEMRSFNYTCLTTRGNPSGLVCCCCCCPGGWRRRSVVRGAGVDQRARVLDAKLLRTFSSVEYCLQASSTSRFVASTSYR